MNLTFGTSGCVEHGNLERIDTRANLLVQVSRVVRVNADIVVLRMTVTVDRVTTYESDIFTSHHWTSAGRLERRGVAALVSWTMLIDNDAATSNHR